MARMEAATPRPLSAVDARADLEVHARESRRVPRGCWLALLILAVGLGFHIRTYWFLTDDAFISFRYARNLAEGHGLVFNPGSKPVEGYTNFLWVVVLAALARLGLPAEIAAPWLGVAATAVLWVGAAVLGWRFLGGRDRTWLGLLVPLALAANRSIAVWATSGLETRLFEILVLSGLLLLYTEARARLRSQRSGFPTASLLLSLAVLTRLDGLLLAGGALLARDVLLWRASRLRMRDWLACWAVFLAPVAVHLVWRLIYYGYPLPNTYYAKLAGQSSVLLGVQYLACFVVEYALVLWIPFLVDGVRAWRRSAPGATTLLGAGFAPFVAYVVYAGGDHFEFRFLDVVWVPLALLFQAGVAHCTARRSRWSWRVLIYGAAVGVLGISMVMPTLSHLDFPEGNLAGFPGFQGRPSGDRNLIRPETAPRILRAPGVRLWLDAYNDLARVLTSHYAALRQEEHRQVAEGTAMLGKRLHQFVDAGRIPEDARISIGGAGAIPYYSRLWTLDRVGLCDEHVAHSRPPPGKHMLAHSKMAEPWYIAMQGVELNAVHPYSFFVPDRTVQRTKNVVVPQGSRNYYVARLGRDDNFLTHFPQGPEHSLPRFPRLGLVPIAEWSSPDASQER